MGDQTRDVLERVINHLIEAAYEAELIGNATLRTSIGEAMDVAEELKVIDRTLAALTLPHSAALHLPDEGCLARTEAA